MPRRLVPGPLLPVAPPRDGSRSTVLTTGAVAACAVLAAAPGTFGLAGRRPFAWTVPFRVPVGAGLAALAVASGVAGLRWRRALPCAAVLGAVAARSLATTFSRGLACGDLPSARPGDVTVLAANVFRAQADPVALTRLALESRADVVSMPETSPALAQDVATRLESATGARMQVFYAADGGGYGFGTALLISERLGGYRATGQLAGGDSAVVTAEPVDGRGPVLAAAHTAAPVPGLVRQWRREVRAVVDWCAATPGAIVAGDLNATLDHPDLQLRGSCVDAGQQVGTGARGTWPSTLPAVLGATIDHALADGNRWRPVGARVADLPGSDHRALLSRWRPVA
ncbi:endonuclease/exonuclease/phosphatase family protein [Kineococcus sp. SYSU DK003]|uniref:endonuclease/exonuclease/phosphatase family protein n=1 Tax=Kineococcus sp. SYSU DK003 TaxID=3383124 RepID=UPI003D7DC658